MLWSSWVTTTNVMPRPRDSSRIVWSRPAEVIGSSPAEGSSRNRIPGSSAMARAMAARFCIPPESAEGFRARGRQEAHLVQLRRRDEVLLLGAEVGELVERQPDVLEDGHRAEERPALVHHAELPQEPQAVLALGRRRCPRRRRGPGPEAGR